jgi:hypothetical protein
MLNALLVRVTRDSLGFAPVSVLPYNLDTVQTVSGYEINEASAGDQCKTQLIPLLF